LVGSASLGMERAQVCRHHKKHSKGAALTRNS
jgi:hypothetical protein